MTEHRCPEDDAIESFAVGRMTGAAGEELALHIDGCVPCQKRLESLEAPDDELLGSLRRIARQNGASGHGTTASGARQIAADAGRDLARKLCDGPIRLDRFELQAELGVGSFGYVFKAWDSRLERVVALKVQRAGSLASHEDVERFLREARSAAQLTHPGIVSLHETGQTADGVWYLVCEYIDGQTLEERLKAGPVDSRAAAAIARDLADALQYAHEHGVIHRDVKPSNVILDASGRAHLMDFGLAKRATGDLTMTSDGRILGTPAYMSPEQAAGSSHQVDARSDLYSLGVVLYELLSGERPFHGNRRLLLLQVLEDEPRPPRALRPGLPRDLEVICLKAMSKAAARRYQSAREFSDDVGRFLLGQPIVARPTGLLERMGRWGRRNPLAVVALAAVLVGSAVGLWHLSSLSEDFVRQTALESVRLETKMLDEVWRFYSEEVADLDPQTTHVSITENYRTVHPALPLPATFAIDLGERISRRSPGMEVRVYSRYPWPGRKEGGPQGDIDREALDWLEAHARPGDDPPREFARFSSEENRRQLFYYTARHMEKSCISCHNHPDSRSPKKDWVEGDVVGVLKIVRPLDREISNTQAGLRGAFAMMVAVSAGLLLLGLAWLLVARRRRELAP